MIKRPLLFMLFLAGSLMLTYPSGATEDPKVRKILKAHVDAMGGLKNWNDVESIRLIGMMERNAQTVNLCIIKKHPDQIRTTLTVVSPEEKDKSYQIIHAYDGDTAWSGTRMVGEQIYSREKLDPQSADQLIADTHILPELIQQWKQRSKINLYINDSTNTIHIRTVSEETQIVHEFELHHETLLVTRMSRTINGQTTHSTFSRYKEYSGIKLPTVITVRPPQQHESTITYTNITVGAGIYDDYFQVSKIN